MAYHFKLDPFVILETWTQAGLDQAHDVLDMFDELAARAAPRKK